VAEMKFSEFCDSIENTEQEQQFLQFMKDDENFGEAKKYLVKAEKIPVVGKVCTALVALSDFDNIAEFRESEYYPQIMDWDITYDPEAKSLSLNPGEAQMKQVKKAAMVFGIVVAVIATLVVFLKICRCRKRKLQTL